MGGSRVQGLRPVFWGTQRPPSLPQLPSRAPNGCLNRKHRSARGPSGPARAHAGRPHRVRKEARAWSQETKAWAPSQVCGSRHLSGDGAVRLTRLVGSPRSEGVGRLLCLHRICLPWGAKLSKAWGDLRRVLELGGTGQRFHTAGSSRVRTLRVPRPRADRLREPGSPGVCG